MNVSVRMNRNSHKEWIRLSNYESSVAGVKGIEVISGQHVFIPFTSIEYILIKDKTG